MKTVLLLLPLLLTACGQAGPLYLPDQGPKHAHSKAGSSTPAAPAQQQQDRETNKTPASSTTP